jgi:hypothetical protein
MKLSIELKSPIRLSGKPGRFSVFTHRKRSIAAAVSPFCLRVEGEVKLVGGSLAHQRQSQANRAAYKGSWQPMATCLAKRADRWSLPLKQSPWTDEADDRRSWSCRANAGWILPIAILPVRRSSRGIERNVLALHKPAHSGAFERRGMNENVLAAVIRLNEAEALFIAMVRLNFDSFKDVQ